MSYVYSIFNFDNNKTILSKGLNVEQYQNFGLIWPFPLQKRWQTGSK